MPITNTLRTHSSFSFWGEPKTLATNRRHRTNWIVFLNGYFWISGCRSWCYQQNVCLVLNCGWVCGLAVIVSGIYYLVYTAFARCSNAIKCLLPNCLYCNVFRYFEEARARALRTIQCTVRSVIIYICEHQHVNYVNLPGSQESKQYLIYVPKLCTSVPFDAHEWLLFFCVYIVASIYCWWHNGTQTFFRLVKYIFG